MSAWRLKYFACRFAILSRGILKIKKKCQIPEVPRIWALFQICDNALKWHAECINFFRPGAVRICGWVPRWKRHGHFACHFRPLWSGISNILKIGQNPEILKNVGTFFRFTKFHFWWSVHFSAASFSKDLCVRQTHTDPNSQLACHWTTVSRRKPQRRILAF